MTDLSQASTLPVFFKIELRILKYQSTGLRVKLVKTYPYSINYIRTLLEVESPWSISGASRKTKAHGWFTSAAVVCGV